MLVLRRAGVNLHTIEPYNELLKDLGGNPLAIQIILPELARIKPDALLASLQSGAAKLSAAEDAEQGRSRSLAASLDYRISHLDAQASEDFQRLNDPHFAAIAAGNLARVHAADE